MLITTPAAIAAGVVFIASIISYLATSRVNLETNALTLYGLTLVLAVLLVIESGVASSPFIALWMLVVFFAPIFGGRGLTLVGLLGATYIIWQIVSELVDFGMISAVLLFIIMPLSIGLLVWHRKQNHQTKEDRSFNELASKLSSVSGQSEVVIAAISDGVLALNKKGEIGLINPAAQKIIGWGSEDAIGLSYKSVLKLLDSQDRPVADNQHPIEQALLERKETTSDHFSILTADSSRKVLLSITASPINSSESGVIVVFRDITKVKAEEREQAEFISTASHEMRTPVAAIEGYLGLALNPTTAQIDEKARNFITKAHLSAQHLGRLFQDLLDVSKADDGRLASNPTVIDVVELTHSVAEALLPQANAKNIRINYKPKPDLYETSENQDDRFLSPVYYTKADADHLRESLNNLVENAIKYTIEGSIDIDVKATDDSITISIQDSGVGIPKEDIDHLFQKFYRVDNSDTREIGGTGLGLYLTRRLVESFGGSIWVESTYQQGSTFFIKIPRLDTVTARQEIESQVDRPEVKDIKTPTTLPSNPAPTAVTNQTPAIETPIDGHQTIQPQQAPGVAMAVNQVAPSSQYQTQTQVQSSQVQNTNPSPLANPTPPLPAINQQQQQPPPIPQQMVAPAVNYSPQNQPVQPVNNYQAPSTTQYPAQQPMPTIPQQSIPAQSPVSQDSVAVNQQNTNQST